MRYNYRRGMSELLGGVAQLGERLLCKQNVAGSIPVTSTSYRGVRQWSDYQAHNLGDGGSNPSPATKFITGSQERS